MDKIKKIKEWVKKQKKEELARNSIGVITGKALFVDADELLAFLDTLSEEPDKGLDVTDFCKPIDPGIAQCVADHWWELLGDKEPNKSLEEAARLYAIPHYMKDIDVNHIEEYPYDTGLEAAFIAGAKWDAKHLRDSTKMIEPKKCENISKDLEEAAEKQINEAIFKWSYDDEDGIEQYVHDSFIAGAKKQKQQMLKDAVEGTVMDFSSNQPRPQVDVLLDPHKYHTGDKVRIIIVKED